MHMVAKAAPAPAPATPSSTGTGAGTTATSTPGTVPNAQPLPNPFGMGGMGGLGMDPNMVAQLMQNPMVQQQLQQLMANPELMQQMLANNPMAQQMLAANPQMAQVFQNPDFMRQLMDPNMINIAMQMQNNPAFAGLNPTPPAQPYVSRSSAATLSAPGALVRARQLRPPHSLRNSI